MHQLGKEGRLHLEQAVGKVEFKDFGNDHRGGARMAPILMRPIVWLADGAIDDFH